MNWRRVSSVVATLTGLFGTVVAAIVAATAKGDPGAFEWAQRNLDVLAWIGLGASLVATIGAYLIMRSRAKEEYREHWRTPGH